MSTHHLLRRASGSQRVATVTAFLLAIAVPIDAATFRLDDSASPIARVEPQSVTFDRTPFDREPPTRADLRFGWVTYRLDTAAFVGKQARIYFVVPAAIGNLQSPSGLRVDWRGRGVFAAGSARPGERVAVWSGVVRERRIEEQLDLSLHAELGALNGRLGFESYFEIEVH